MYFVGGVLSFVSFCKVGVWTEPWMLAVTVIVVRNFHPWWVKVVFNVSYFLGFLFRFLGGCSRRILGYIL